MTFTVYILRNSSDSLYIGQTNNPDSRIRQHITKDWKAAKFAKDGDGFSLVYKEEYSTRLAAMRREIQLKGWSRAKKEALIAGDLEKLKALSKKSRDRS